MSEEWKHRQHELNRIRTKYFGPDWARSRHSQHWPKFRGDPGYPPLPTEWDQNEVMDAVLEALNQEGVTAWNGDATGIVVQLIRAQFDRWKLAESENKKQAELIVGLRQDIAHWRSWAVQLEPRLDILVAEQHPTEDDIAAAKTLRGCTKARLIEFALDYRDGWLAAIYLLGKKEREAQNDAKSMAPSPEAENDT